MISIEENVRLKPFNTFGIEAKATHFVKVSRPEEILELITTPQFKNQKRIILGGGSNILFTKDFDGLVIKNELKGKEFLGEVGDKIRLRVMSGEVWHDLVMYCIEKNWGGIENLSLIPGTVGAAPIQNIGAYGVEVKDCIESVECIDLESGRVVTLSNEECCFGYRESIFKTTFKEKFFISSVTLTLTKEKHPLHTEYGAIQSTLREKNIKEVTIKTVSDAVTHIRRTKLPDPHEIGNAGSFFKNPTVPLEKFEELKKSYPEIQGYHTVNQQVKLAAGWLIEQCGWKGKTFGSVGVHAQQSLVIVNTGGGKGNEILELAMKIKSSVREKFDVELTPEVNII